MASGEGLPCFMVLERKPLVNEHCNLDCGAGAYRNITVTAKDAYVGDCANGIKAKEHNSSVVFSSN